MLFRYYVPIQSAIAIPPKDCEIKMLCFIELYRSIKNLLQTKPNRKTDGTNYVLEDLINTVLLSIFIFAIHLKDLGAWVAQ